MACFGEFIEKGVYLNSRGTAYSPLRKKEAYITNNKQ
jgi:hypothetical protein